MTRRTTKKPAAAPTATKILDLAEMLIQTRGYSAFSYQDIAAALGIRKASIHHHFASKEALGVAVVDRYAARFGAALAAIAAGGRHSPPAMLDFYMQPYFKFARTPDRVCLSGALAGEMPALPGTLRTRVERFFKEHQAWLAGILERGATAGAFRLPSTPARTARLAFGALQGALLVKRTTGDMTQMRDVAAALKEMLAGPQA